MKKPALVLASQSPRRKELLAILGIPFSVLPASIDETPVVGEKPEDFVVRAAREKGMEVASRVSQSVVLSADTVVTIDGEILGKPLDAAEVAEYVEITPSNHPLHKEQCQGITASRVAEIYAHVMHDK